MVRFVFGQRRKTLRNSLRAFLHAEGAALPEIAGLERRPEELTAEEHVALANQLQHLIRPQAGVYPVPRGS